MSFTEIAPVVFLKHAQFLLGLTKDFTTYLSACSVSLLRLLRNGLKYTPTNGHRIISPGIQRTFFLHSAKYITVTLKSLLSSRSMKSMSFSRSMIKASNTSWLDTRICYHFTAKQQNWQSYRTYRHFYPAASPQCCHWIQRQSWKYQHRYHRFRCLQSPLWLRRGSAEGFKQWDLIQRAVLGLCKTLGKRLARLYFPVRNGYNMASGISSIVWFLEVEVR